MVVCSSFKTSHACVCVRARTHVNVIECASVSRTMF